MSTRHGLTVELIYDRLRADILSGGLPAGASVSQTQLTQGLGASRTPVREALRILAHEGLVDAQANRRVRIRELTPAHLEDLQLTLIVLEHVAASITVPELTSDDNAQLEGLLAQMAHYQRVEDLARFEEPHRRFHTLLVHKMGVGAVRTMTGLHDQVASYRRQFAKAEYYAVRQAEHRTIRDRAIAGDARGTADALVAHHVRAVSHVFTELDPNYIPRRLETAANLLLRR